MELERITPSEAERLLVSGAPVVFIDARSAESWEKTTAQIQITFTEASAYTSALCRRRSLSVCGASSRIRSR
jgi:hypothetical protein